MDGPHVNWDVLSLHSSYREKNALSRLTNIGSIGLYVLPGALKSGIMETDREVSKVLQAMWKILMNHPQGEIFILGKLVVIFFFCIFCKTRWFEDKPVAARGIQI